MHLFVFGLGYTATRFLEIFGDRFNSVSGTRRAALNIDDNSRTKVYSFITEGGDRQLISSITRADTILVSIPPGESDPTIASFASTLVRCNASRVIYLSTLGVYGDQAGQWVDESRAAKPDLPRLRARIDAEQSWRMIFRDRLSILRLGGIYGPRRNAFENLKRGTARRIVKPGQVFNRIHVDDAVHAIAAAIGAHQSGVWNVCDDEPAPPQDVIEYAAEKMGIVPPPVERFEEATMSDMARSFYSGNARVANARLKRLLGRELLFPNYRRGLDALWSEEHC